MCTVCEILKSLDIYSVQYLGWVTAIVGGIITLATIVFTHYNERTIERSNDLVEEIRFQLDIHKNDKENLHYQELMSKFNKVISALSNNQVYKSTLFFFEVIFYGLAALWLIGSLGYALNSETWIEKIIIMTASFILIGVFLFIPEIVKAFNKSKELSITSKGKCSYNESLNFFKYNNILDTKDIISNLVTPSLSVSINNDDHIIIKYSQGIAINNYFVVFQLVNKNEAVYISLDINSDKNSVVYSTTHNTGMTFRGLYDLIKSSSKTKGNVFIFDSFTLVKSVYKLSNIHDDSGSINLGIKDNQIITNKIAENLFEKKESCVKLIRSSSNDNKDYSLTRLE